MTDMRKLMKFLEEEKIKTVFWFGPKKSLTGVPQYKGFDIDTGDIYNIKGEVVAGHDFRSLVIINPDNYYVQEHQP